MGEARLFFEIQGLLSVSRQVEGQAMIRRGAMCGDGGPMFRRGIALVAVPSVIGIFGMQAQHIVVAASFGQDGGCGNGQILAVSLDKGRMGNAGIAAETVAVYQ